MTHFVGPGHMRCDVIVKWVELKASFIVAKFQIMCWTLVDKSKIREIKTFLLGFNIRTATFQVKSML